MFGIFKKKKLHERVLILNAIPYTESQFKALSIADTSDFIRSLNINSDGDIDGAWNKYKPVASMILQTLQRLEGKGATVVYSMSLQDIADKACGFDIIVLIAHHSDSSDEIEIDGTLVDTKAFVNAFPPGMKGIVDLTSCYSSYLIPKLKLRNPDCKFIGIATSTSLNYRLFLLEETIQKLISKRAEDYKNALSLTLSEIAKANPGNTGNQVLLSSDDMIQPTDRDTTEGTTQAKSSARNLNNVKLGSERLKSTVFAPAEVNKGQDFLVQIFIHADLQTEEVTFTANLIDEDATVRNSKSLSFQLRETDKIEFQLMQIPKETDDFEIEKDIKGFVWNGESAGVEFVVSVSKACTKESFIGKIKIAVNKMPMGDIMFKTKIVEKAGSKVEHADLSFNAFDREKVSDLSKQRLISLLNSTKERYKQSGSYEERDMDMCDKCIEILNRTDRAKNQIFKVFISSTSDMKSYRLVIKQQVDSCEMYADMYERWGQGNDYPRDKCCQHVMDSDIFVGILGSHYGFVEPIWGLSMTEIEYRIAEHCKIPILIYIEENWKKDIDEFKNNPEQCSSVAAQEKLIDELSHNRLVYFFNNETKLATQALAELLKLKYKIQNETIER